jgi:hypothetical protein
MPGRASRPETVGAAQTPDGFVMPGSRALLRRFPEEPHQNPERPDGAGGEDEQVKLPTAMLGEGADPDVPLQPEGGA